MAKIQLFLTLTLLSGLFFGLQSCGKGGAAGSGIDLTNRVPATATMVFTVDVGQMMAKADFEKIKTTAMYKKAVADAPEATRELMADPALVGLDLKSKWIGFVEINDVKQEDIFGAFMMPIADKAKWEGLIKRAEDKNGKKAVQKTGYKIVNLDNEAYLAWDDKLAVLGGAKMQNNEMTAKAEQQLNRVFKPEGANIQANAEFKKYNSGKHDMLFWASTDEMFKQMLASPEGSQLKLAAGGVGLTDAAFIGNSFAAYQDYQNGKIESSLTYQFSPELRQKFGKVFNDGQKGDYAKYLPAQNINFLMGASINLEELHIILSSLGLTNSYDQQLAALNLNSKDLLGALKGEGLIGIYFTPESNMPNIVFVAGVNNKANVGKLLEIGTTFGMAKINGDRFEAGFSSDNAYGYLSNDILAVSNKIELVDKIAAGGFGGDAVKGDAVKTIQSGWAGIAVLGFDFLKQASNSIAGYGTDQATKEKVAAILTKEIINVNAVAQSNKATGTTNLKTTNKNALARWFELLEEVYQVTESAKNVQ